MLSAPSALHHVRVNGCTLPLESTCRSPSDPSDTAWDACSHALKVLATTPRLLSLSYVLGCGLMLMQVILTYTGPTLVGIYFIPDIADWEDGVFVDVGQMVGGAWLSSWMGAAGVASSLGILCTMLCTTSRMLAGMATTGNLPSAVGALHSKVSECIKTCGLGFKFALNSWLQASQRVLQTLRNNCTPHLAWQYPRDRRGSRVKRGGARQGDGRESQQRG